MTVEAKLDKLRDEGWDVMSLNFADLILSREFSDELQALLDVLLTTKLSIAQSIIKGGGGLADQTQELAGRFNDIGKKNNISVINRIEFEREHSPIESQSTSHEIDHLVRNIDGQLLAIELEWNNKDEFYDRDFQSVRRLYELGVIEAGVIVTRGQSLEEELLPMTTKFFEEFPINDFEDFKRLSAQFPDPKKEGESLFTFPTSKQAYSIKQKTEKKKDSKPFHVASAEVFKNSKFVGTTTNWRQLQKRIDRRDAGRTPILFLGIPASVFE